jgi:deazaflavin-dependent oxidoreductase (nitroreductase family)
MMVVESVSMSEPISYERANVMQRILRRFAASGPGSWLFARLLHRVDRPLHRLTGGRYTFSSLVSGLPVVMLTTVGAKTGQRRTVPVLGLPTENTVAIIASNFGQHRHPAWYHNLQKHPDAEIVLNGTRRRVRAVEAKGQRRAEIWREGLRVYPGFEQYERRAPHRNIVVFVLEPADASA